MIESGGGFTVPHFHTNENEEYRTTAPIIPRGLLIVVFDWSRHTQAGCSSLESCTMRGRGRVSLSWYKCGIPSKPLRGFHVEGDC